MPNEQNGGIEVVFMNSVVEVKFRTYMEKEQTGGIEVVFMNNL
jgi:hypothetical protein